MPHCIHMCCSTLFTTPVDKHMHTGTKAQPVVSLITPDAALEVLLAALSNNTHAGQRGGGGSGWTRRVGRVCVGGRRVENNHSRQQSCKGTSTPAMPLLPTLPCLPSPHFLSAHPPQNTCLHPVTAPDLCCSWHHNCTSAGWRAGAPAKTANEG